jgi:hypothetical protein
MSVALSQADRQLLIDSAPDALGDHVVSSATGAVFALVRKDKTTPKGRIVAVARSAEEVLQKICPPGPETPAEKPASKGSPWRKQSASAPAAQSGQAPRSAQSTQAQQRAAAAEMQSELAEYRRACAAAGVTAPKLV